MERKNSWLGPLWAVDPGKTCGWAHWMDGKFVSCGEADWREMLYQVDQNRVQGGLYVVESFRVLPWMVRRLAMDDLLPVQVIGAIRYLVGDNHLVLQEPGLRLWFASKDWGRFGVSANPQSEHVRDAIMHGLYWFYFGRMPKWSSV